MDDVQSQLQQLYALNDESLIWVKNGKPSNQALAMINSLEKSDDKGLNPSDYDVELLNKWLFAAKNEGALKPGEAAAFDLALSVSTLRYLSNIQIGRVNPLNVGFELKPELNQDELLNQIKQIASGKKPETAIKEMEPDLPIYRNLLSALKQFNQLAQNKDITSLSIQDGFTPGSHHKDLEKLRRILLITGDLPTIKPEAEHSDTYDPELVTAVKSFQKRQGLKADGVIGKKLMVQLNAPPHEKIQKIKLGLERVRWLPKTIRGDYLIVNIPSYQLYAARSGSGLGQQDLTMNVIIGQAIDSRKTPVFTSTMSEIIFHPYWNVPDTIASKELVPIIRRNPGYLARNNLEIVSHFAPSAKTHTPHGNTLDKVASGSLKLRMKPGRGNALGLVKFVFPNEKNIYLHSTPAKGLFQRSRRDFSHGCVRVQDPVKLAEWVLNGQDTWTHDKIVNAMAGPKQSIVSLTQPIPVYILYSTVLTDATGRANFYEDIYGHDKELQKALAKGFPYYIPKPPQPLEKTKPVTDQGDPV